MTAKKQQKKQKKTRARQNFAKKRKKKPLIKRQVAGKSKSLKDHKEDD